MYTIKKESFTLELEPFVDFGDLYKRKTEMQRIKVKSYRFYAETEFPADTPSLAEFAEQLNRLYETLDGEAELKSTSDGYNRLKFEALHRGQILISGTLSMRENGQSYEMTFYNSIDQTVFRDFAKLLYSNLSMIESR